MTQGIFSSDESKNVVIVVLSRGFLAKYGLKIDYHFTLTYFYTATYHQPELNMSVYNQLFIAFFLMLTTHTYAQSDTSAVVEDTVPPKGKFFMKVPDTEPEKTSEDFMKEAVVHFDGGRYAQAVSLLDEAIKINEYPQLTDILYYYRANANAKLGKQEAAIQDYNEAIAKTAVKSHYYYHRAYAHYENEDYENAENDFRTYMAMEGESADIYMKLGFLKQKESDLRGAIKSFSKAIEFNPKLAEAYYLRGGIFLQVLLRDKGCQDMKIAADLGHEKAASQYTIYCGKK